MNSLFLFVENGSVLVKKFDTTLSPSAAVSYGANLISFEAEVDARSQFQSIKAQSWDSAGQEMIEMESVGSANVLPGNLTPEELAEVSGLDFLMLRHSGQISDKELKAWSDAMMNRSRLAGNTGNLTLHGNAALLPGQLIALDGLGDRFNGNAPVSGVRHVLDQGSWLTHVSFGLNFETFAQRFRENLQEIPASGLTPSVYGLQAGIVSQLENDPKSDYRIKVKLPAINPNDEGIWARLALPHAGSGRGMVFRPEIGDEVVIGFMNDDPRNPVVIGSLHSSANPSPVDGTDDNHEKILVTRSGMKIAFNDEKKVIEISTPRGYFLKLDEDSQEIMLEDENGNSVKLNIDGISIESVKDITIKAGGDVRIEGMNIELAASVQLKAEGSAGLEASSSGMTVIKGSMVQIN
jgi:Rhs element Vgr protein